MFLLLSHKFFLCSSVQLTKLHGIHELKENKNTHKKNFINFFDIFIAYYRFWSIVTSFIHVRSESSNQYMTKSSV